MSWEQSYHEGSIKTHSKQPCSMLTFIHSFPSGPCLRYAADEPVGDKHGLAPPDADHGSPAYALDA